VRQSNTLTRPVTQIDIINHASLISSSTQFCFTCFADEEYSILPKISNRNELHKALEKESFEEASRLVGSESETHLVECFEREKIHKSCLHIIAAMRDTEQATRLCRQLLERISNKKNREYLLNMTTVDEFDMVVWKDRARVAAIHIAAYNGNSGVVRLLCQEYGVDVNCSTSEALEEQPRKGITALEWAAMVGHTEVVKVLLDNNADVNARRTDDGATPLDAAAYNGHTEVVKLLLDNNADVNARRTSDDGATPLYIAADNGHTEVVRLLLDNNADVNARHADYGSTPLYAAAYNGHTEVVKLLLDNNANTKVKACNGEKPVDAARRNRHSDIVELLKDSSMNPTVKLLFPLFRTQKK